MCVCVYMCRECEILCACMFMFTNACECVVYMSVCMMLSVCLCGVVCVCVFV